jgi:hypothetical protein
MVGIITDAGLEVVIIHACDIVMEGALDSSSVDDDAEPVVC